MSTQATVATVLRCGLRKLRVENPRLEAEVLLANSLQVARSWLHAHPEMPLNGTQEQDYQKTINDRAAGLPLPYLIGHWEFFGLDFVVDSRALIPRPETELLVEEAISISKHHLPTAGYRIADVGSGCGIIAVSLALQLPSVHITASDISMQALHLTYENAHRHGVSTRVHCVQSDLLTGLDTFDIICANLPYISTDELSTLPTSQHEPRLALYGGHDGLSVIRRLLSHAPRHLRTGGYILLEIGSTQGDIALELAHTYLPDAKCDILPDLSRKERMLRIRSPQKT
ncbi:MAG: peptide chain release factor N(5)-glutamine methyltransferase [Anaerolineales bacterium]|nr:peptide chain release factor N(5)-glutamine methyltransferase [Anaerolineales bacterium]